MCITWFDKLNFIQQAADTKDPFILLESMDEHTAEAVYLLLQKQSAKKQAADGKSPVSV